MKANLGILDVGDVFHLTSGVRTDEVDRMYAVIGRHTPAHCIPVGKARQACLPTEDAREIIHECGWRPRSPHSIQDVAALEQALAEIREVGFAVDREEVPTQIWCMGAAVFDATERIVGAIISVTVPPDRVEPPLVTVAREVIGHTERLALRLGDVGPHYRNAFVVMEWRMTTAFGRAAQDDRHPMGCVIPKHCATGRLVALAEIDVGDRQYADLVADDIPLDWLCRGCFPVAGNRIITDRRPLALPDILREL